MGPSFSRRSLLHAIGSSGVVLGAGCLDSPTDAGGGPGGWTTGESGRTPTRSSTRTTTTGADTRSPTTAATPELRVDDFYIENRDEGPHCVSLTLSNDGEAVLGGSYALAGRQGARFENVGREGETYAVRARLDGGEERAFEWAVDDCPPEYEGDRNGGVVVQDGELAFRANNCDAIALGYALNSYLVEPESADCTH